MLNNALSIAILIVIGGLNLFLVTLQQVPNLDIIFLNVIMLTYVICTLTGDSFLRKFALGFALLGGVVNFSATNSLTSYYLLLLPYVAVFVIVKIIRWEFDRKTNKLLKLRSETKESISLQEDSLHRQTERLHDLEVQVKDIINLFDVAKHFNTCLDFAAIAETLHTQVSIQLVCKSSTLIILDDVQVANSNYQAFILEGNKPIRELSSTDEEQDDVALRLRDYIAASQEHKNLLRLDYPMQFDEYFSFDCDLISLPLWLFPLIVENRLIGIYLVEGASRSAFPKYSIVATQLALQIKKIKLYSEVKELAITDGLTEVYLRRYFLLRFEEELRRSKKQNLSLAVLMLDIDHFKTYNDSYGHLVGDATLKEVANVIKDSLRQVDLVGRYGGEEFVMVLPETSREGAIEAAERIRSAVARSDLKIFDVETNITVSIGIAVYPEKANQFKDNETERQMEQLIDIADEAMYQAKTDGRNRVICS